ncbi:MAG: hypothetical protein Q9226_000316 [Calogaya cf. arnoldii]
MRRDFHHANRPTKTLHFLRATPTVAARMAQSKATVHRDKTGLVIQISDQKKAKAEDGFAPSGPHSTSFVQADVHCFRRVRIASIANCKMYSVNPLTVLHCSGDVTTLSTICTEGLLASFKSRIAARPRNERFRWNLHKFIRAPKFVSQRVGVLPYKGSAIRQVVVRMRSRQSLARMVSRGPGRPDAQIQGTGEEKDVTEYLVLQRRIWKEIEEPWMVWGTTDETDPDTVLTSKDPAQNTAKI